MEIEEMEAEILKLAEESHAQNMKVVREVFGKEPELARKLEISSRRMLDNIRLATEFDGLAE